VKRSNTPQKLLLPLLILVGLLLQPAQLFAYDKEEIEKILQSGSKKYTGTKLSMDVQEIPVRTVMGIIAKAANKNIVVHERVQGNITLNVTDVPWDQLFEMVLRLESLYDVKEGNVIIVVPVEDAAITMGAGR
jgi:type IV pilus assembly protein PilQ